MIFIFLSFLTGITIVLNMVLNGYIAQREGMINGIMINYFMAVVSSLVVCIIMLSSIPSFHITGNIPLLYFSGGIIGVLTTFIFNTVAPKIPAVYVVILRFTGQMAAGALIDYIFFGIFSRGKVLGGLLFLTGLIINAGLDQRCSKKKCIVDGIS